MQTNRQRRLRHFLVVFLVITSMGVSFTAGAMTGGFARPASAQGEPSEFGIFWETWELVDKYFVDQEKIDPKIMTYGAIDGMLATLGDEGHTAFLNPEMARQEQQAMEGSFEGIGAYVDLTDNEFRIVAPIHGSPAEAAGILAGDVVMKVDGEDITGLPETEVISRIRGPKGTQVVLTVLHKDEKQPVEITVTRDKIDVESVTWARIPETELVYLQIAQFAEDTGKELEKALKAIEEAKQTAPVKGILLDLRNNPGGYLNEALSVNSEFLPEGQIILHERDGDGEMRTYKSVGKGLARDIPMVVLINEGTASAGEITAGALQENERANLIGQPTLGTGTVLTPFTLSDGSVLRLGVTNWLTPKENLIKGQGVKPDTSVSQEVEIKMVDSYLLQENALTEILAQGDKQFNLGLFQLRLKAK
ncbi:MAG: S41 family peptidase [Anaerolineales bacterium]|nr:S41 family peptidase [Anaerolineales bacterium]